MPVESNTPTSSPANESGYCRAAEPLNFFAFFAAFLALFLSFFRFRRSPPESGAGNDAAGP